MTRYYNIPRTTCRSISVNFNKKTLLRLTIILSLVVVLSSCHKGILNEGEGILPGKDLVAIKSIDTLSIFSYTYFDDSTRTDNPILSYVGQDVDPYFGTTSAGLVTQIRLGSEWSYTSFRIDSVALYLHLLSVKGNITDAVHTLRFREISRQIFTDSAYYSTPSDTLNNPVTESDSSKVKVKLPALRNDTINNIRLQIPAYFGRYLTRDVSQLFYSNTKTDFRSYFRGLRFDMLPGSDPLLISFSVAPPATLGDFQNSFVLYIHDNTDTIKTDKIYNIVLDASNKNAAFNLFFHDFSTATLGDKLIHRNTTYKDTISYLQALNGPYTRIVLPGLAKLKSDPSFGKVAVNRAKLVVPFIYNEANGPISKNLPPEILMRFRYKGARVSVPEYTMSSSDVNHAFFDGRLDSVNKVYNFNIPAFVQAYLDDANNLVEPEVEIYQSSTNAITPAADIYQNSKTRNLILAANKNKKPIRFEFTFTKF